MLLHLRLYIGDLGLTVTTLRPRANGSQNQLENSADGIPNSPTAWNSESDQSDLTLVQTDNLYIPPILSGICTFPCTNFDSGGGTITNVRVYIRYNTDILLTRHGVCKTDVYIGVANYQGNNQFSAAIVNTFKDYALNPATGLAWTDADVNAAEFGGSASTGGLANQLNGYIYDCWVEVTWSAAALTVIRLPLVGVGL